MKYYLYNEYNEVNELNEFNEYFGRIELAGTQLSFPAVIAPPSCF